jgi:hypothetical protein
MYDARLANNSSVIHVAAPAMICPLASMGVVKINQQKPNTKIKKAGSRYRAAPLTLFPAGPKMVTSVDQIDTQQIKCAQICASTFLSALAYPKKSGKDSRSSRPSGCYVAALRKGAQCPASGSALLY